MKQVKKRKLRRGLPVSVFKLDNGLTVVVQEDRSAPLAAVSLTYKVGSLDEEKGRAGFAHLFEHLMFQGTANLAPNEVSRLVESHGGVDNAYTMKTNTTYHEVVPSNALESVLWAEADRMRGLLISERELAVEKQVVLEELRQTYLNQPYRRATDAVMSSLAFTRWETAHPTIGDAADIRAASLDDVRTFYDRHYAPNNAVLAIAGDASVSEVRKLVKRLFGPIPRRPRPKAAPLDEPRLKGERVETVKDHLAKTPLTIVGWHTPERGSRDWWALTVVMTILGGGEDSPLHEKLVKDDRLAVSAGGHIPYWSSHVAARGPDMLAFFISGRLGVSRKAVTDSLDKVLERFFLKGPNEDELARAKTQIERSWLEGQQSLADRAQTLSSYVALVGDPDGFWKDLDSLLKITRADCVAAARRWLRSRGRIVLQVEPGEPVELAPEPAAPETPAEEPRKPGHHPPPPGPARFARPPDIVKTQLKNGLTVWLARDKRLPLVEARLALRAGRIHEVSGQDALAQASEELLLKGREGEDAAAVARAYTSLGWSLGASCESEWLKLSASGLSRNLDPFLDQLAKTLNTANYPEAEVELWRENALEDLISRRAQPHFLSEERLRVELFPGHPYGRGAADEKKIAAVDSARMRAFHAACLRPNGGHLVLVGDLDPDKTARALERALSTWTAGPAAPPAPPLPDAGGARTIIVDRPGSAQASLIIAQTAVAGPKDPDYMSLVLANHVLGGTANSRLFENLRTRRGYTYGAYSSIELYGRGIVWSASADCRTEVARPALEEMLSEVRELTSKEISAAALDNSRRHLRGLFLMRLSSLDRITGYLSSVAESGRDPRETIAQYEPRLAEATPASALAAVNSRLDLRKLVTVVVGDESALKPALKGL
ncbi:MAG: insulinase family protein [Elusimicrobia bacterium]|nr:insulinase family protein [Elusimicrobiota bacterium]